MGIKFEGARVFITGGAGFVGSHLADRVLRGRRGERRDPRRPRPRPAART